MARRYPPEVLAFVKENVEQYSNRGLAEKVNELFGTMFTEMSMRAYVKNHKLYRKDRRRRDRIYTSTFPKEVVDYIETNYRGVGPTEMTQRLNTLFGTTYTVRQLNSFYKNHELKCGLTGQFEKGHIPSNKGKKMSPDQYEKCKGSMFKKGHKSHNRIAVGEYSYTSRDRYLIRKVREHGTQRERFEFVHRAVWAEHNGPIPEGMMVIFLDGDRNNCSIENLALVSKSENAILNHSKLRFDNAEATQAGLNIAKIKLAARKRKKGKKEEEQ